MRILRPAAALSVLVAACSPPDEAGTPPVGGTGTATGTSDGSPEVGPPQAFVDVTDEAGVGYLQHAGVTHPSDCLFFEVPGFDSFPCDPQHFAGGVAIADVDGDGWPDLFVTRLFARDLLFFNRGDGTFEERGEAAGLDLVANTNGAAFFDMEGDGDPDLYVTSIGEGRNYLWENLGDGTFVESALARGAALAGPPVNVGTSVVPVDFDQDGDLDLYVGDWRPDRPGPEGAGAKLLRNLGPQAPGTFEPALYDTGLVVSDDDGGVYVFAAAFADFTGDGVFDAYVVADFRTSRFFVGRGDGTFDDRTNAWRASRERNGMGIATADVDGDGDLDVYVTSIGGVPVPCEECINGTGNFLYRNDGDTFADLTDRYRVREGYWGWGAVFADFDQDGDPDLVTVSGMVLGSRLDEGGGPHAQGPILYYRSRGPDWPMAAEADARGLDALGAWKAVATFDYDRDGDLDLFVTRNAGTGVLYRNDTDPATSFLIVDPRTPAGVPALGARVEVEDGDDLRLVSFVGAQSGFLAQSEPIVHFGIPADRDVLDRVRVVFPTGVVVERTDVPAGTRLRIDSP